MNKRYKIQTYDYGIFWRYAKNPLAAKYLLANQIFGYGWRNLSSPWESVENWLVNEA